jgi:PIN domain nuclease of toxin-antitoxin system
MKILIDSQVLIWALSTPEKLSSAHTTLIKDSSNQVLVSMASLWEIHIKSGLGKLQIPESFFDELDRNYISILSIKREHLEHLLTLPMIHRDPFDRLIISQAIVEKTPVITYDKRFGEYPVEMI